MKTEFWTITQKLTLVDRLKEPDPEEAINLIISEMDRIEGIVRNYEIGLIQAAQKIEDTGNKKPQTIPW